jgi:L-lactate dehydrogenase complex protein LldE
MRIAFFVTCLVDLMRPNVGFAALKLLERAGCEVIVPDTQTCCGQPAYNNGDAATARDIAKQVIEAFGGHEYVVIPSGSCAGMLIKHYPALFEGDPAWHSKACNLAARCHELIYFLDHVLKVETLDAHYSGVVAYHDSCSALRELAIYPEPRRLLNKLQGVSLAEIADRENCCGFGGTFCVKYPEISERMVTDKVNAIVASGADTLVSSDLGCLLNIAGRLKRLDKPVKVYHVAELLAGMADEPGLGDGQAK